MHHDNEWSIAAALDLERIKREVECAHPGVIDPLNPSFKEWLQNGHEQAMRLIRKVNSRADALAVLRFYTTGFRDNHLSIHDPTLNLRDEQWSGWLVQPDEEKFIVVEIDEARNDVPALGAELVACDGMSPGEFIEQHIAPYVDRRLLLNSVKAQNAGLLSKRSDVFPTLHQYRPEHCLFRDDQGRTREIRLRWQRKNTPIARASLSFSINEFMGTGTWVSIPTFQITPEERSKIMHLLSQRPRPATNAPLVFDLSGNNGGNSDIGREILHKIVGSRPKREVPQAEAYWRVSELSVRTLQLHTDHFLEMFGEDHPATHFIRKLMQEAFFAQRNGLDWVRQPDSGDQEQQLAYGSYQGKIVAIIDGVCASACLDFLDELRLYDGVVLVGQQSGADTVYIDVSTVNLPRACVLNLPLKVWRGRSRQSNEPIDPDVPYPTHIMDQMQLEHWIAEKVLVRFTQPYTEAKGSKLPTERDRNGLK